jgi:uncharacterized protein (TIGR01777 family)
MEAALVKVAVSGSSGLIGRALSASLTSSGHTIVRLVRSKRDAGPDDVYWSHETGEIDARRLDGVDAVVHLAGENVESGSWTPAKKACLRDSRVRGAGMIVDAMCGVRRTPRVFVTASAVNYYGNRGADLLTEDSEPGRGFLADVFRDLEAASQAAPLGVRVVNLRLGAVLSPDGGLLSRALLPARLGFSGPIGSGAQYVPWIAIDDVAEALRLVLQTPDVRGPLNVVAPDIVTNEEFVRAIARALDVPVAPPLSERMARRLFGERTDELLLASQRVSPQRLLDRGFRFRYPTLDGALRDMVDGRTTAVEIGGFVSMLPAVVVQWSLGPTAARPQTPQPDDTLLDVWQLRRAYAAVTGSRSVEPLGAIHEIVSIRTEPLDALRLWADTIESLMWQADRVDGADPSRPITKRRVIAAFAGSHPRPDVERLADFGIDSIFTLVTQHELWAMHGAPAPTADAGIETLAAHMPPELGRTAEWLAVHRRQLQGFVNVIAAAVEAAEAAESLVGKSGAEKKAYAHALVLRFLQEEAAASGNPLEAAAANRLLDAAIDTVVHLFKKRDHFVHDAPAPIEVQRRSGDAAKGPPRAGNHYARAGASRGGLTAAAVELWAGGWARLSDAIVDASEEAYHELETRRQSHVGARSETSSDREGSPLWRSLGLLLRTGIDTAVGALGSTDARRDTARRGRGRDSHA